MKLRICAVIGVFLAWTCFSAAQTAPTAAGHWEGSITLPNAELGVVVDLDQMAGGGWHGDLDIPQQQSRDVPLSDIAVSGRAVAFGIRLGPVSARFEGKLSDDGSSITGTFTQDGNGFPFTLKRTGKASVFVPAKAAALPDRFTGKWEGTLTTPAGTVRLVFYLANKDGGATGTLDSPDQGFTGLRLDDITATQDTLTVKVRMAGAAFTGTLGDAARTLAGEWSQGGQTFPLVMKKAG